MYNINNIISIKMYSLKRRYRDNTARARMACREEHICNGYA